ncbi:MAG TPA: hypothetical protein VFF06_15565, partial [Polyangia bacterium]|nr:hypothetical protein [Polyangia bacterium]
MSRRPIFIAGIGLVVIAACAVLLLYLHRRSVERAAIAERKRVVALGPTVLVKKVLPGAGTRHLTLPGEARAFVSTTLYAKLPGYLHDIRTDKGLRVKKNDVLAVVWSPESDQDVRAAET